MSSGAPTAGLPATDGKGSGYGGKPPALLSESRVKHSEGTARPHYGVALIDAADRKNRTDPAIRQAADWL